MQSAVDKTLRLSCCNYLFGANRKVSRANSANLAAHFLFWPNMTMSFEVFRELVTASAISEEEKDDIRRKTIAIGFDAITDIENLLRSVSDTIEATEDSVIEPVEVNVSRPIIICGRRVASDLPTGRRFTINDELYRYRSFSGLEFEACK